jgi:hypothetical protein
MSPRVIKIGLFAFTLYFGIFQANAQIVGANFNERIWEIDQNDIADSKVSWIRAFIPIMSFVNTSTINGVKQITGINQTKLDSYDAASLVSVSQMPSGNETIKLIISFKFDFLTATNRVPTASSSEADILVNITNQLLNKSGLGNNVDILVVGNEPMWETPSGTTNVDNLGAFTTRMINEVYNWKTTNSNWKYDIFAGSINRFSQLPTNPIRNKILSIAKNNDKVVGLDLHCHIGSTTEIVEDFRQLREDNAFTKDVISTEFSLFRIFEDHKGDNLGTWGTNNGYTSDMKVWEWINVLLQKSLNNTPVTPSHYISYFNSTSWYPQDWFQQFYSSFINYNVKVATYGLERSKDPNFTMTATSTTWVLNALRNEAILGNYPSGLTVRNPMCYPKFREIVGPFNFAGIPVQVSSLNGGNVLDVQGCSTDNGANVQVWTSNGNLCQQWMFNFKSAGEYEIRSVKSNLALDVQDGSLDNGANVRQWTPNGMPAQTWLVQPLGNNQYRILSKKSGKSLDIAGCSTTAGANVQQWTWNGAKCQQWILSNATSTKITGVSSQEDAFDFNVYPNPTQGAFQIQIPNNGIAQVSMYDTFGHSVYKMNDVQGSVVLDTDRFEKGIYVIELVIDGQIKRKKLIIE